MKKILTVFVLLGLALLLLVGPVLAAGAADSKSLAQAGPERKAHVISLTGTVVPGTEVMTRSGLSFDVKVQMTNAPFMYKRGSVVTITTTSRTIYITWATGKSIRTTSVIVADNAKLSINALVDTATDKVTARRVELNKPRY